MPAFVDPAIPAFIDDYLRAEAGLRPAQWSLSDSVLDQVPDPVLSKYIVLDSRVLKKKLDDLYPDEATQIRGINPYDGTVIFQTVTRGREEVPILSLGYSLVGERYILHSQLERLTKL